MHLTQYWDRYPVPPNIAPMVESYRGLNQVLEHRCMDYVAAERFIADHFTTREVSAFRSCAVPAMQADYFRYCAVLALGGFYADADDRCIAPLRPLLPDGAQGVLFQRDNENVINGCFAFREPGHPLLTTVLEIATASIERRLSNSVWITTGPGIFTFLRLLSVLPPEERVDLNYDAIDPDATKSIRLCRDIASERHNDLDRLFDGVHVAPFSQLMGHIQEVWHEYKGTPQHWAHWSGSIFR